MADGFTPGSMCERLVATPLAWPKDRDFTSEITLRLRLNWPLDRRQTNGRIAVLMARGKKSVTNPSSSTPRAAKRNRPHPSLEWCEARLGGAVELAGARHASSEYRSDGFRW